MSFDSTLTRLSSAESVASPLRKKSILALASTKENIETDVNDDDAERRERRRKSLAPDRAAAPAVSADSANRRKSLGLGACSGLSTVQLAEHYASCIKLSTENKITVKNAFSLQLIDYMSMMLKRHDKQMEDFQVASCTLDASTKIYSFRVDAVHSEVVQMASAVGRSDSNRKRKPVSDDEDMDQGEDGPLESQVLKKLKKKSRNHKSALVKPESLLRKQKVFKTMNPFLVHLSANLAVSQSGECPFHHSLKHGEDTADFGKENGSDQNRKSDEVELVPLPEIPDLKNLEICPSFRDFKFLGWMPENDPGPTPSLQPPKLTEPLANLNIDHAFDINQTPEPIPDVDFGVGNDFDGFDSDHEEIYAAPEAASKAAAKFGRQPPSIVDLKHHLSTVPLEYSYFQQSILSLWAGPTHWKVKPLRKDKDIAVNKDAKKRIKKEMRLSFSDEAYEEVQKAFKSFMKKSNKKTIQSWTTERATNPCNIHFDPKRITREFLRECFVIKGSDDTPTAEVDDGVGDYQYDNPTDQASFCPNVPLDEDDDNGADAGNGMVHDDDMLQSQDNHTEIEEEIGAFTGDNLIAPPNKVAKTYIPYQLRAKKMDMKKLKNSMWAVLTNTSEDDLEDLSKANLKVENSVSFQTVYNTLSSKLPQNVVENLSCPLAFVGLLHLANEKNLIIKGTEDMSDVIIDQD